MSEDRFEVIARILARSGNRRSAGGWLAALAALAGGGAAGAERARRRRRPSRIEGPCGDRSRKDNVCTSDKECCTRVCDRSLGRENRDGKGRCRCLQRGDACREARNCCGSLTCAGGVCQFDGGGGGGGGGGGSQGTCSAASCAAGCCRDGACLPGTEAAACGTGGGACAACSGGTPSCRAGVCSARSWQGTTPMTTGIQVYDVVEAPNGLVLYATQNLAGSIAVWTRASAGAAWQSQVPLGSTGTANDQYINPWAVALSTNMQEMFVSDYGNNRVAVWTATSANTGWTAQTPLGNGQPTAGAGNDQFSNPAGVALSANQLELYVADNANNRVAIWTRSTIGGTWTAQTPLGNGAPTSGAGNDQFSAPTGLALSPDGLELYVADSGNVRIAVWKRSTIGGTWTAQTPLGNGSGTDDDQFGYLMGMAMSPDGLALYIADWTNNRVDYWARPTLAGAWAAQPRLGRNSGGSGVDQFVNPAGLGLSPDGLEMYVADQNNQRIAKWIYA